MSGSQKLVVDFISLMSLPSNFKDNRFKGLMHAYKLRKKRIMSEREQEPAIEIEVLRWDADSFTVEGMNLELENLKGRRIAQLILRHNGKIIDNLTGVVITRVYRHQDNRHRHEETEFRYIKDVMRDSR